MRAIELTPAGLALAEVDPPKLPDGWVRVAVAACGVCRSDLHLARGGALPPGVDWPLRPGHEVAGTVTETGTPAGPAPGTVVALHTLRVCGACPACRAGTEERCPEARVLGIHDPGGLAEEVVWPADRVVPISGIDPVQAALLPDAVATAHHALRLADPPEGGTLGLIGPGGVGSHVLQLARALRPSVELVAVTRSEPTAARLAAAGIRVVRPLPGAARAVRQSLGLLDAVIDFSGAPEAPTEGLRMLAPGGRLVLGAIRDEPVSLGLPMTGLVTRELTVTGCYASTLADLGEVAALAAGGRLDLSGSVSARLPLAQAGQALQLLEDPPGGLVRVVVEPGRA